MSLAAKQVCLGPVKLATCTDFIVKSGTTLYFLHQPDLLLEKFKKFGKRASSLFNSFCGNVAQQIALICCLFHPTFSLPAVRQILYALLYMYMRKECD